MYRAIPLRTSALDVCGPATRKCRRASSQALRAAGLLAIALVLGYSGYKTADAQTAGTVTVTTQQEGSQVPGGAAADWPARFGFGHTASPEEITAWDIDIRPDGHGLPPGSGTVSSGADVYAERCSACHGVTGVEGPYNMLVGRQPGDAFPFAEDPEQPKTIGSYWPYATTVFDYIRRAMPPETPGSLSDDEVYGLTAYLLHLNEIVPEDVRLNRESLPQVVMPAVDHFRAHDR